MRAWLRRFRRGRRPATYHYLESACQFRRSLERERMRADRHLGMFSLVELGFDSHRDFKELARRLEFILERRLRFTDIAGVMSRDRIGLLLPDTPGEGAQTVVRDVTQLWATGGARLVSRIHVYSTPESAERETAKRGSVECETPHDERRHGNGSTNGRHRHSEPAGPDAVPTEELVFAVKLPVWKRTTDIVGAVTGMIVSAPLIIVISLLILATSGRPVVFRQLRTGLGGRRFWIYKFRTMIRDAELRQSSLRELSEQDGPAFRLRADPRVTRLGRYLRRTSIDELPQLWNVLKGDMTLVGPRPLPCSESNGCSGWQLRRLDVTPGLTCTWQIDGKSRVTFAEWMRMDLRYLRKRTPWRDFSLILRTVVAVVVHRTPY